MERNFFVQMRMSAVFLVCGGLLSVLLKYEMLWDFANYHYFNPWALLNGRVNEDAAVAGLNAFFNPLIDVPLYLLIKYFNDYPNFIYFMQGLWFGALAYAYYKIASLFFAGSGRKERWGVILSLAAGLSGYAVFFQIGTSTNEIPSAFWVLLSLWLLLREIFENKQYRNKIFFCAGLVAGLAAGLKFTGGIYGMSIGVALVVCKGSLRLSWRNIMVFAGGCVCGFVLADGYWMWILQREFGNPFFPFFNAYFRSPYLEAVNYRDAQFIPTEFWRLVLLPFYWVADLYRKEGGVVVIDWRLALAYVCLLFWGVKYLWAKIQHKALPFRKQSVFLCVFAVSAYVLWLNVYSIVRYMIPIEMLASLLTVGTLRALMPEGKTARDIYLLPLSAVAAILLLTPLYSQIWGCRNCEIDGKKFEKFVEVKGVNIPDNALLMFYNFPTSALLPYFSRTAKNLQGVNVLQQNYRYTSMDGDYFNDNPRWKKLKKDILARDYAARIAFIAAEPGSLLQIDKARDPILKDMDCRRLETNIYPYYEICVSPDMKEKIFSEK